MGTVTRRVTTRPLHIRCIVLKVRYDDGATRHRIYRWTRPFWGRVDVWDRDIPYCYMDLYTTVSIRRLPLVMRSLITAKHWMFLGPDGLEDLHRWAWRAR